MKQITMDWETFEKEKFISEQTGYKNALLDTMILIEKKELSKILNDKQNYIIHIYLKKIADLLNISHGDE